MSVFCKAEGGEWDEGRSGGKAQPPKVKKQQKSRLCMQSSWARLENRPPPFADSCLHSWSLITDCTFRGHKEPAPCEAASGDPPRQADLGANGAKPSSDLDVGVPADAARGLPSSGYTGIWVKPTANHS